MELKSEPLFASTARKRALKDQISELKNLTHSKVIYNKKKTKEKLKSAIPKL